MKYRKKQIVVEAMQYRREENIAKIQDWLKEKGILSLQCSGQRILYRHSRRHYENSRR